VHQKLRRDDVRARPPHDDPSYTDTTNFPFGFVLIRGVGVDHVLLGSDFPQFTLAETLAAFEELNLTAEEKKKIRYQNAQTVFARKEIEERQRRQRGVTEERNHDRSEGFSQTIVVRVLSKKV